MFTKIKNLISQSKKNPSVVELLNNNDCKQLLDQVREMYANDMTGLIVVIEKKKQTYWHSAGMEPAQAILSLDQLHHRVQHEGLVDYK